MKSYKSLVRSYIESGTAGYVHASVSVLNAIDRLERRFVRELLLSEEDALIQRNWAPLPVRRATSILGLLRRINLGTVSS